jgi:hypothetical protein
MFRELEGYTTWVQIFQNEIVDSSVDAATQAQILATDRSDGLAVANFWFYHP